MTVPAVSVVTSVFNGSRYLRESIESVLAQDGVDFEFIVIDDGSTDDSGATLDRYAASDSRMRVFHQPNEGLTRALIRGCREARGELIARHDADDISMPGRLAQQAELLSSRPELSFVSCGTEFIGPANEPLYEVCPPNAETVAAELIYQSRSGPTSHGSVMVRADLYRAAGGYRAEFKFAQDWDLWLRLAEVGGFAAVPERLYRHRVTEGGVSGTRRAEQLELLEIARECHLDRVGNLSEAVRLRGAAEVSARESSAATASGTNAYFIGKCLLDKRDRRASGYFAREIRRNPFYGRAWLGWIAALVLTRADPGKP